MGTSESKSNVDRQKYFDQNIKGVGRVSDAYDKSRNFYNQSMRNAMSVIDILSQVMDEISASIDASKKELQAITNDLNTLDSIIDKDMDARNQIQKVVIEFEKINDLKLRAVTNFNGILRNALNDTKF